MELPATCVIISKISISPNAELEYFVIKLLSILSQKSSLEKTQWQNSVIQDSFYFPSL